MTLRRSIKMQLNKLTDEEKSVILGKQTEAPFSGEYDEFFRKGMYVCRQCNNPLYSSEAKFKS
ncbi:MAG: peptide-methionine (R)-S-oxide reductase, partial [Legionellales bacterium]